MYKRQTSADGGVENSVALMTAMQAANSAKNVYLDGTHAFNNDSAATGYYSNVNPALNLFAAGTWVDGVLSLIHI